MNEAYQHLEDKFKIGEFTITQWLCAGVGVAIALFWLFVLSPVTGLPPTLSFIVTGWIGCALPTAAILLNTNETHLPTVIRWRLQWTRATKRYEPGPGAAATGYYVPVAIDDNARRAASRPAARDLAELFQ
jgi:hypothetical protein